MNTSYRIPALGLTFMFAACITTGCQSPTATEPTSPPLTTNPADNLTPEPTVPGAVVTEPPPDASGTPAAEPLETHSEDVIITSAGKDYPSYLAAPTGGGPYPGIVLIHSINGLEHGYKTLSDKFASRGYVVLALGWQTFERTPPDNTVRQLVEDGLDYLSSRRDVDTTRLGLTGFCAGGRFTMLLLPQIKRFNAGVAWYGFPYNGTPSAADLIDQLDAPILVIHGTADGASPIADAERYVADLQAAGKSVEYKYYDGEPHGFMLQSGELRDDVVANDAFDLMVDFFRRMLG